jgi:hypothetical protein
VAHSDAYCTHRQTPFHQLKVHIRERTNAKRLVVESQPTQAEALLRRFEMKQNQNNDCIVGYARFMAERSIHHKPFL